MTSGARSSIAAATERVFHSRVALAPTEQAGLIGVDANENPVPHLRVDDKGSDARNLHRNFPSRQTQVVKAGGR